MVDLNQLPTENIRNGDKASCMQEFRDHDQSAGRKADCSLPVHLKEPTIRELVGIS
jgi:hypothetical protein